MTFNNLYNIVCESSGIRSYSCLMIDLTFLSDELQKLHEQICPCEVYDEEAGHALETEFHSTVLYGIHTDQLREIRDKIDIRPVTIKFGKLSLFENEKYDVLKFDIISKDMNELNKQLCENIPFTNSFPDYKCHSTVGYIKPNKGKFYTSLKSDLTGETFVVNSFIFSDKLSNKTYFHVN